MDRKSEKAEHDSKLKSTAQSTTHHQMEVNANSNNNSSSSSTNGLPQDKPSSSFAKGSVIQKENSSSSSSSSSIAAQKSFFQSQQISSKTWITPQTSDSFNATFENDIASNVSPDPHPPTLSSQSSIENGSCQEWTSQCYGAETRPATTAVLKLHQGAGSSSNKSNEHGQEEAFEDTEDVVETKRLVWKRNGEEDIAQKMAGKLTNGWTNGEEPANQLNGTNLKSQSPMNQSTHGGNHNYYLVPRTYIRGTRG